MSTGTTRQLWQFPGGLRLPSLTTAIDDQPVRAAPPPECAVLPLLQHSGNPARPIVDVGEHVLKGQCVAEPAGIISASLHAPVSGVVRAIEPRPVPHPSGLEAPCIVIDSDGRDEPAPPPRPVADFRYVAPAEVRHWIQDSGIVGLGGAGFSTAVKLTAEAQSGLHTLVLNGAECDPSISCDNALLRTRSADVVAGAQVLMHVLQIHQCLVAVERDMPAAAAAMAQAIDDCGDDRIELVSVPAIYPEGGERQLIQTLSGQEVPSDGLPVDVGFLVQNVGTAAAVADAALRSEPLISRIVTVAGDAVAEPCNIEVRFGTPVADVVAACGGYAAEADRVVVGGVMMGFALRSDSVPITKVVNSVTALTAPAARPEDNAMPCIRCGECARACPVSLQPQQLHWHARASEFDQAVALNLFYCIECGCCDQVCPSHIPLAQYFRYAKAQVVGRERASAFSSHARRRHEARLARLERDKAERAKRLKAKRAKRAAAAGDPEKAVIADVMERVRAKKARDDAQPGDGD